MSNLQRYAVNGDNSDDIYFALYECDDGDFVRVSEAEAEITRWREALQKAVLWLEGDRYHDEYIAEDWYYMAHKSLGGEE